MANYNIGVFTRDGISHSSEVAASSLEEAAKLAHPEEYRRLERELDPNSPQHSLLLTKAEAGIAYGTFPVDWCPWGPYSCQCGVLEGEQHYQECYYLVWRE